MVNPSNSTLNKIKSLYGFKIRWRQNQICVLRRAFWLQEINERKNLVKV